MTIKKGSYPNNKWYPSLNHTQIYPLHFFTEKYYFHLKTLSSNQCPPVD